MTALPTKDEQWQSRIADEILRRVELLERISDDVEAQALVRRCVLDPSVDGLLALARDWAWTYDPRLKGVKTIPFVPWPEQEALLRSFHAHETDRENLFVDKSRDTGVTWFVSLYYVHRWLTVPGWVGSFGSRKADLLDRLGDSKSIFWKVRHIIDRLPTFLKPVGYSAKKHAAWARVINPENGATITGEAGEDMGRGGRSSVYTLDEFGKMAQADQVEAAVAGNTNVVFYITTATGPGTRAHDRRHSGIDVFGLGWEADPRLDAAFHAKKLADYGLEIVAREYDRNWGAMDAVSVIPAAWVRAAVNYPLQPRPNAPRASGFDVADGGAGESVHIGRVGGLVAFVDAWNEGDVTQGALRVYARAKEHGSEEVRVDSIGVGAGAVGTLMESARGTAMVVTGVNVGNASSRRKYDDDGNQNEARHRFTNLRAELHWQMRLRFQRTYEARENGAEYEPDELISIPDDPVLIGQLSQPRIEYATDGRVRIESKESMAKRGIRSPDRSDALLLCFADVDCGIDWTAIPGMGGAANGGAVARKQPPRVKGGGSNLF